MPEHLKTSSLSNWDGSASLRQGGREGQERAEGMDEFGRMRKADVYMDGDIPGLGQISAREDEEQVPGLSFRPRTPPPLASSSLGPTFSSFTLSPIDRDVLPSYAESQLKPTNSPPLPHRHTQSTSSSENANMTLSQSLRTRSMEMVPLGSKSTRKPVSSYTMESRPGSSINKDSSLPSKDISNLPPSVPRADPSNTSRPAHAHTPSSLTKEPTQPNLPIKRHPPTGPRADSARERPMKDPPTKRLPPTGPRAGRPQVERSLPSSSQRPPPYPTPSIPQQLRAATQGRSSGVSDSGWPRSERRATQLTAQNSVASGSGSRASSSSLTSSTTQHGEKPQSLIKSNADKAKDMERLEKLRKESASSPMLQLKPAATKVLPTFKKLIQGQTADNWIVGVQTSNEVTVREGTASTLSASMPTTSRRPPSPKPLLVLLPGPSTTSHRQRPPSAEHRTLDRISDEMKGPNPNKPSRRAEPGPSSHRAKDNVDPLFTPPRGDYVPLFTPPGSPLSPLSSPEPVARWVETPEPDDDVVVVRVVKAKAKKKKTLRVCVVVPRLSKAERKTYKTEDEETLGSRPLVSLRRRSESSAPRASSSAVVQRSSSSSAVQRSSSAAPRKQTSSSSVQRSSSSSRHTPSSHPAPSLPASYHHPQRKAKQKAFVDIEEQQSLTNAFRLNEFYELDDDDVVEVEDRVVHIPRKGEAGPSKSQVPVASTSKTPASHVNTASRAAPVAGDVAAAYNQALGAGSAPKEKGKLVTDKGKQKLDKGKGKARAVDDDEVVIVSVETASSKKRKRVDGVSGDVAKKARVQEVPEQEPHSKSSAKILTLDFEEAMDDEALYTVTREPGALDFGPVWNYKQKWGTEVHALTEEVLRRNLKGYRRLLLGSDEWYEEEEDGGRGSDMELESEPEPMVVQSPVKIEDRVRQESPRKGKGKKPVDIRDKMRIEKEIKRRKEEEALGLDKIVPLHGGDDHDHEHHHDPAPAPVHDGTINPALLGGVEDDVIEYAESSDEEDMAVMEAPPAEADTDTDGEDDVPLSVLVARRRATSEVDKDQRRVASPKPQPDNDHSENHPPPPPPDPSSAPPPPPAPKPKGRGRFGPALDSVYPTRPNGHEINCHQCRRKSRMIYMQCQSEACTHGRGGRVVKGKIYCVRCITERYDEYKFVEGKVDSCPACEGICSCDKCTPKRGEVYVGPYTYVAGQGQIPQFVEDEDEEETPRPKRQRKRPERFVEEQGGKNKEKEKEKRGWRRVVKTRAGLLSGKTMWESVEKRIAKGRVGEPSTSAQAAQQGGGVAYWGAIYGAEHAVRVGSAWVPAAKRKFAEEGEEGGEDGEEWGEGAKVYVQRKRVYVGAVVPEWGLAGPGREGPASGRERVVASGAQEGQASACGEPPKKKRRRCFVGDPRPLGMSLRKADVQMEENENEDEKTEMEGAGMWDMDSVLSELTPSPSPSPEPELVDWSVQADEEVEVEVEKREGGEVEVEQGREVLSRPDMLRAMSAGLEELGVQVRYDLRA